MMTGLHGIHILIGMVAAELARYPRPARRILRHILHAGRPGRPVLALGRFDLDLPVPAVLLDHMSTHTEHADNPKHETLKST